MGGAGILVALSLLVQETPVTPGQAVEGRLGVEDIDLATGKLTDAYSFDGRTGQHAVITLASGDFDAYLALRGPGGYETVNDDAEGRNSRIEVDLPADGRYVVVATSYNLGESGRYTLLVRLSGGEPPPSETGRTPIQATLAGDEGTLPTGQFYDTYSYVGRRGEPFVVTMSSRDFDTVLVLRGSNGWEQTNDDIGGGNTNSRLAVTLPEDGPYTIYATSYQARATGAYTLMVEGRPPEPTASVREGTLTAQDPLLPNGSHYHQYRYVGRAGEALVVEMASTEFDTYVMIQGPNGWQQANDDVGAGNTNSRIEVALPADGEYLITATAYRPGAVGAYRLTIGGAREASGGTGDNSATPPASIAYGATVAGELTAQSDRLDSGHFLAAYAFDGAEGDLVEVTLASSAFNAWTKIWNGTAILAENDDADAGSTNSRILYPLPAAGRYWVLVTTRDAGQMGAFELRLGCPSRGAATPPVVDLSQAGLTVDAEAQGEPGRTAALPDGTSVTIPPGGRGRVTLRRLTDPGPEGASIALVQVESSRPPAGPATLVLPCPQLPPEFRGMDVEYRVCRVHDGTMETVDAQYDAGRHAMVLQTREFSYWFVFPVLVWLMTNNANNTMDEFRAGIGDAVAPMDVPYYAQDGSMWCWAASTAMMLKTYGRDYEIWDLARMSRSSFDTALPDWLGHWYRALPAVYEPLGFRVEHCRLPWADITSLSFYVMRHLRAGRPVFLAVVGAAHAFVAVGYTRDGIYLHDPAGIAPFFLSGVRDPSAEYGRFRHAAVFFPWPDFFRMCHRGFGWVYSLVVTNANRTHQPVTVQAVHGEVRFTHPVPTPMTVGTAQAIFRWNGQAEAGYEWMSSAGGVFPPYATNSSRLEGDLRLTNAAADSRTAEVVVSLGGRELSRQAQPLPGGSPPFAVLTRHHLNVPLAGAGVGVGRQPLDVVVNCGGEQDRLEIFVNVGPSQVGGLRTETRDHRLVLTWSPVPESGVAYGVCAVVGSPTNFEAIAETRDTQMDLDPARLPAGTRWLAVSARHEQTGLWGVPSNLLPIGDAPSITIESPANGTQTNENTVEVTGVVRGSEDGRPGGPPIRRVQVVLGPTVYNVEVSSDGRYTQRVLLRPGDNVIVARAENPAGRDEATVTIRANIEAAILKVIMSWRGDGNDVDLHVTDPQGRVTGYSDAIGPGSRVDGRSLDIDDTSGPGTETYTMTAEVPGTYTVRIDYYRGAQPQGVDIEYTLYEGTPQESRRTLGCSLGEEDHNSGRPGANYTFTIDVPPRSP